MIKKFSSALVISALALSSAFAAKEKPQTEVAQLGKPVKDFTLTDTNGKQHKLSSFKDKTVVLEWVNYECPFVRKYYDTGAMQKLQAEETKNGVIWLSVNSSAKGKQGHLDPKAHNERNAKEGNKATATIIDESGELGRYFEAKTTPHMYVINGKGELVYRGGIDDKPSTDKEDVATAKNYVKAALDDVKAGRKVAQADTKPYGCGVKYK